jgi:hypothetical protein
LKKCEVQITNFQLTGHAADGKLAKMVFKPNDPSNNIAAYKKLRDRLPKPVRDYIEGYLDERAHRESENAKQFAGTGGTGASDLTDLGNA